MHSGMGKRGARRFPIERHFHVDGGLPFTPTYNDVLCRRGCRGLLRIAQARALASRRKAGYCELIVFPIYNVAYALGSCRTTQCSWESTRPAICDGRQSSDETAVGLLASST